MPGRTTSGVGSSRDEHLEVTARAAAANDPDAIDALLRILVPYIGRYCWLRLGRLGGDPTIADDVAQNVCVAVLHALPRYRDRGGSIVYLVRAIAANKVVDAIRAQGRNRAIPVDHIADQPDPAPTPEQHLVDTEHRARVGALLRTLSTIQRDVLVLRVVHGLSVAEAAHITGASEAHVRVIQHRALTRLRIHLTRNNPLADRGFPHARY